MKKHLKIIIIVLVVIIALVSVAFAGMWLYKNRGKTYTSYTVKNELEFTGSSDAGFLVGSDNIIKYTRDGASSYDTTGKEEWNVSYEMSNPICDVCGEYAAAADYGSENLYIFDNKGSVNHITTEYPIECIAVASQGVTAVWMNDGTKDYITVYETDGEKVLDMMTTTGNDGLPVAMDISDDGTKLVTSYIYFEDNEVNNKVTFYNFGEVGSNYVDRLVGLKKYSDRMVADVQFIGSDTVVAFSDVGISIFSMEEYEEEKTDIQISDEIVSVALDDEYIGAVTTNDTGVNTVTVYNLDGTVKDTKQLAERYEKFAISDGDLIFYGGTSLYITRINGKDKALLNLSMDINGILPIDGKKKYMIAGENALQIISLEVGREAED
jgi:uncharacterized protein YxeA